MSEETKGNGKTEIETKDKQEQPEPIPSAAPHKFVDFRGTKVKIAAKEQNVTHLTVMALLMLEDPRIDEQFKHVHLHDLDGNQYWPMRDTGEGEE